MRQERHNHLHQREDLPFLEREGLSLFLLNIKGLYRLSSSNEKRFSPLVGTRKPPPEHSQSPSSSTPEGREGKEGKEGKEVVKEVREIRSPHLQARKGILTFEEPPSFSPLEGKEGRSPVLGSRKALFLSGEHSQHSSSSSSSSSTLDAKSPVYKPRKENTTLR